MKIRVLKLFFLSGILSVGILLFVWLLWPTVQISLAATCSGSGCNNTNPNSTGCDASATTLESAYYPNCSSIRLRYSNICYTRWARTQNGGYYKWTKATLKGFYLITRYIAPNQAVYTNQQYSEPYPGWNWQACGMCVDYQPAPGELGSCSP